MARALGPRKVRRYGNDFKARAVRLSQVKGVQVQEVAESLGIHPFLLSRWRKELREGKIVRKGNLHLEPKTRHLSRAPHWLAQSRLSMHDIPGPLKTHERTSE